MEGGSEATTPRLSQTTQTRPDQAGRYSEGLGRQARRRSAKKLELLIFYMDITDGYTV